MLTLDFDRWAVGAGELMLDLGCGRGRHSFEALARGLHVVSVDLDEVALKQTQLDGAELRGSGMIPRDSGGGCTRADGHRLPFADAAFDRVVASEVLEHIARDTDVMAEIFRVLRPGGSAVVTVPRYWPERICWMLSDEYHEAEGGHLRIYSGSVLRSRLRAAGFEVVDSHHAHALHSPYWWLKCAVGVDEDANRLVTIYRRLLEWDILRNPRPLGTIEQVLNPALGKSLVVYLTKPKRVRAP
ncbi:MAG: class I SAM-dependent methyltransferase [Actinomycetota bacterium]